MSRSNYWCFTLNNPTEEETTQLKLFVSSGKATYLIFGEEHGTAGTYHLQGYIELPKRFRLNQLKSLLPRAHLEPRIGTSDEASEYCRKDGVVFEDGIRSQTQQGKRNDLMAVAEAIMANANKRQIAKDFPIQFIRYHKGIEKLIDILQFQYEPSYVLGPWKWDVQVTVGTHIFWGNSGVGKTEFAKQLLPKALFVTHIDSLARYDSSVFEGIIFDDMSFLHLPREAQIHLVDQDNARDMHVRYQTAHIPANTVKIFTTNVPCGRIFLVEDEAIRRRVTIHELN